MDARHRPLAAQDFLHRGPLRRLGQTIVLLAETDSTNSYVLRNMPALPDGAVVCAEYQTAGRGRFQHAWLAPRGSSILLSVLLLEPADSQLRALAATLGCLAVCETVSAHAGARAVARWPNDVTLNGRKISGVLAEVQALSAAETDAVSGIVLGVGLNCLQQSGHFTPQIRARATSLEMESSTPVARGALAGELLSRLDTLLDKHTDHAASAARLWNQFGEPLGTRITLERAGETRTGELAEIDPSGALSLRLSSGVTSKFRSGVWIRRWDADK